jgi:hypothetical protein
MTDDQAAMGDGARRAERHKDACEAVSFVDIGPEASVHVEAPGRIEFLLLNGSLTENGDVLREGAWLREPEGQSFLAVAGADGAKLWMKTGHLRFVAVPKVWSPA